MLKKTVMKIIPLLTAAALLLTGCGVSGQRARLTIVTSFYPVYIAALNVVEGVEGVELVNMTQAATGCLHDYQLSPRDLVTLDGADLFLINGGGMESFLDSVFKTRPNLPVVEAATGISLIEDEPHDYEDEHSDAEAADPGHDHGANAHVWVSPILYVQYVQNIADALKRHDPGHTAQYEQNAAAYIAKVTALYHEIKSELEAFAHSDIVTFHEAFAYFADAFDLHIAAVIENEPGVDPGPRDLAALIRTVRETGCRALFTEPQYAGRAAAAVARETGAGLYELDPSVTGILEKDAYIDAMRKNAGTVKEALGT